MTKHEVAHSFSRGRTLLFSAFLIVGTLGLLEGAMRLVGAKRPPRPRILLRSLDVDIDFPFMRADPELFWAPRPGWSGEFLGQRVTISPLGLRGPAPSEPKPAVRGRLATFGDSITFGYGVGDDDVYAHQLAARAELQGWDTINAGVTGFTSHQVLALVRRLAPRLHLDAATFCIGWNDGTRRPLDDRAFGRRLRSSMAIDETLEHSYLYRGIKNLYLRSAQWEEVRATDRPRVSLDQYRENLRDIVRECRAAGIRPAFISLPRRRQAGEPVTVSPYSVEMARVAKELQVPLIGVGPLGADAPESGNVRCFVDSLHLSVEGHRVMAQEVARQLEEAGLLR